MCSFMNQARKEFEQVRIDCAGVYLGPKDIEGSLRTDGLLVRPVGGSQCVEDVDDREDAWLDGNFRSRELVWIARAVQLLMMPGGDSGDAAHLRRPRYLAEKAHSVGDMRL